MLKSEFKGQIDLSLFNAFKLCILIEVSVKISMAKKMWNSHKTYLNYLRDIKCLPNFGPLFCDQTKTVKVYVF